MFAKINLKRKGVPTLSFSHSMHNELMVRAAYYYYEKGLTQTKISELLGVSRLTLGRILKQARAQGIVKIEINDSRNIKPILELEDKLCRHFHLSNAIVVNCVGSSTKEVAPTLSRAAAGYVERNLRSGMHISMAWGHALNLMVESLVPDRSIKDLEVATLVGGSGSIDSLIQPEILASKFLSNFSGKGYAINAPFYCRSKEVCLNLREEPGVREVLEKGRLADMTLVGIGAPPQSENYWASSFYSDEEMQQIIDSGAVGDICGNYFNAQGLPCCGEINDRLVGTDLESLKTHKSVIALAGGTEKHESIAAALRGGYLNVLITDQHTAKAVLEM